MNRAISHMDLDTFFVSCERLKNSDLVGKPLIIGGGDRGVVASCSYETRYFGVKKCHVTDQDGFLRLCRRSKGHPGAIWKCTPICRILLPEIIQEKVPVLEKASIDEFYLDLSGWINFSAAINGPPKLQRQSEKIPVCPSTLPYLPIKPFLKSVWENLNLLVNLKFLNRK